MIQVENLCKIHNDQLIIAYCQNRNCKEQYRGYCKECEGNHQNDPQQSKKSQQEINQLIADFKKFGQEKIDNSKLLCQFQDLFHYIELIEYMKQWKEKYNKIHILISSVNLFREKFDQINLLNYDANNKVLQDYFNPFKLDLMKIDKQIDNYLNNRNIEQVEHDLKDQHILIFMEESQKCLTQIINDLQNNLIYQKNADKTQDKMFNISEIIVRESYEKKIRLLSEQFCKYQNVLLDEKLVQDKKLYILAYAQLALGNPNEGLNLSNKAIESNNKNYQAIYVKGLCLEALEKYNDSLQFYEQAISLNNKYIYSQLGKAKILQITKKENDAINVYKALIQQYPDNYQFYSQSARLYRNLNKFEDSLTQIDKAIGLYPVSLELLQTKGELLQKLKRNYEYIECTDQIIALNPTPDNYNAKIKILNQLKQYDQVIQVYNEILQKDQNNYEILVQKGLAYSYQRNYEQAIQTFDSIINQKIKYFDAYHQKAQLMIQKKKDSKDIINVYEQYISIDPTYFEAYHQKAIILRQFKHSDEEILKFYQSYIDQYPDNCLQAKLQRALILTQLKRYQESLNIYDELIKQNSQIIEIYIEKGKLLQKMINYNGTLTFYDQFIQAYPKDYTPYQEKALFLQQNKYYDLAIKVLDRYLLKDPNNISALIFKAKLLDQKLCYDQSLAIYDQAIRVNQKDFSPYQEKGILLERLYRFDDAIANYNAYITNNPQSYEGYLQKVELLKKLNRNDEIIKVYDQIIGLDHTNFKYIDEKSKYLLSSQNKQFITQALENYDKYIKQYPHEFDGYANKGNYLRKQKSFKEAIDVYEQYLKIDPQYINALLRIGSILQKQHKHKEAISKYERLLQIEPNNYEALKQTGRSLQLLLQEDQALTIYEKLIQSYPDEIEPLILKANSLVRQINFEKAIDVFTYILNHFDKRNINVLLEKAIIYQEFNKDLEAFEIYHQILEIDPENQYAYDQKYFLKQYLSEFQDEKLKKLAINPVKDNTQILSPSTLEDLDLLIQDNPRNFEYYKQKGLLLEQTNNSNTQNFYDNFNRLFPTIFQAYHEKAQYYFRLKKYQIAIDLYDSFLSQNKQEFDALYHKCRILQSQKRYDLALRSYDQFIKSNPPNLKVLKAKIQLLVECNRYDEISEVYLQIYKLEPNNIENYFQQVTYLTQLGKYDIAESVWNTIIQKNCEKIDVLQQQVEFFRKHVKKYELALSAQDKILKNQPKNQEQQFEKAIIMIEFRKFQEAINYIDQLINQYKAADQIKALIQLYELKADALKSSNKYDECIQVTNKIFELDLLNKQGYKLQVQSYELQNSLQNAIDTQKKLIMSDNNDSDSYIEKGRLLQKSNKHLEAIDIFDIVINEDQHNLQALQLKLLSCKILKRYQEAIQIQERIYDINNDNKILQEINLLQQCYDQQIAIIKVFDQYIKANPIQSNAYKQKLDYLLSINSYIEAFKLLDEFIKQFPNIIQIYHEKSLIMQNLNRQEQAIKVYDLYIQQNPKDYQGFNSKIQILQQLNELEQQIPLYEQIIKLQPTDHNYFIQLSQIFYDLKQIKESVEVWDVLYKIIFRIPKDIIKKLNFFLDYKNLMKLLRFMIKE